MPLSARRAHRSRPNSVSSCVRDVVRETLESAGQLLLAVSGGVDSMCLLDAAAATIEGARLTVATFDHRSGPHSLRAVRLVQKRARELGLSVIAGRADCVADSEANWRDMRWSFLRSTAEELGARVVTAHTRDDQVETVLIRIMRDAGARGIAGLFAESPGRPVLRPLLAITRADVEAYARAEGVPWADDPTNASMRHLRNRVRRDILPALRSTNPRVDDELLDLAMIAAQWRREVESFVDHQISPTLRGSGAALDVDSSTLAGYSQPALATLWPAIVSRIGQPLDHRGTRRLVAFTRTGSVGSRVQLSGGWEVVRGRHRFEVRRVDARASIPEPVELMESTRWEGGRWRFRRIEGTRPSDAWMAGLPSDRRLTVRRWMPGDTMIPAPGRTPRKVKRLLSSAGITGHDRTVWPVVLAGDEIVWIPGVRRSEAVIDSSGQPLLMYCCEFDDR